MSFRRVSGSVRSRQPTVISVLTCWRLATEGVIKLKPPLPAGFGKIFPSISQNALRSPYRVLSGTETKTGLRLYISRSNSSHIDSDSEMCVSASTTFFTFVIAASSLNFLLNCGYASQLASELSRYAAYPEEVHHSRESGSLEGNSGCTFSRDTDDAFE